MKIYTKCGDAGQTSLLGGVLVSKDHVRVRAYGSLDELNSVLGVALSMEDMPAELRPRVLRIQGELLRLGTEVAVPRGTVLDIALISESEVEVLEHEMDEMVASLPELTSFILPGGSPASAHLHLARSICRRAERDMVTLHRGEPLRNVVLQYCNRLGDYLFICARFANNRAGGKDVLWRS